MKAKTHFLIALALLFGAKAFGQEWEYSIPYYMADPEMTRQYCAYELSDGRIIVSASFLFNDGTNTDFYPPHNSLVVLSADGQELARMDYFKDGYWGSSYNPYVFENEVGEVFMLTTYSPDHNPNYFNYFLNYDNPPTEAILGLYKLNDDYEIAESYEYSIPVDTTQSQYAPDPCGSSGSIHLHSAILDDGCIVGAYTKNVSYDRDSIHGYDSLFFFRMNFEGELLANVGYELPYSGYSWQMIFWREQLVSTDYGYIYYNGFPDVPPTPEYNKGASEYLIGTVCYLDKDFSLLKHRYFKHSGIPTIPWTYDDVSIMRSKHNTTYLATRSRTQYGQPDDDCYLYEFDDDIDSEEEFVPIVHELLRGISDFDFVAEGRAIDVRDDQSLIFCYSLNVGLWLSNDSWVVIEHLDNDFNTITEVYYSTDSDLLWYCAESITLTKDGGVLMIAHSRDLTDLNLWGSVVVKFPAEAFVGIEEAHENGLKVAIAYPNPGKDVLNIRTGLRDAWVEVYDLNGRMVYGREITENVTAIDAGDWADGVYVWKVISNGKEAESGKWIKQ